MTMTEPRVTKNLQIRLAEIKRQVKQKAGIDISNKVAQDILLKLADGKTTIVINKKEQVKVQ